MTSSEDPRGGRAKPQREAGNCPRGERRGRPRGDVSCSRPREHVCTGACRAPTGRQWGAAPLLCPQKRTWPSQTDAQPQASPRRGRSRNARAAWPRPDSRRGEHLRSPPETCPGPTGRVRRGAAWAAVAYVWGGEGGRSAPVSRTMAHQRAYLWPSNAARWGPHPQDLRTWLDVEMGVYRGGEVITRSRGWPRSHRTVSL